MQKSQTHFADQCYYSYCTAQPRKFKLRFFKMLANSKSIWDILNSETMAYSRSILIIVYKNICSGCVKETSPRDVI